MDISGDPAGLLTDTVPSSKGWPTARTALVVGSAIVLLSAVEIGWWWLQRYRFRQYRRDHPNTVFLTPHRPRLTKWGRVVRVALRLAWAVLVVTAFGCCVTLDCVVIRGIGTALRGARSYTASLWDRLRARRASWNTSENEEQQQQQPQEAPASTFVLAPILRSKSGASAVASAAAKPAPNKQRAQGDRHKQAKKGVTFEEHSNGHIRHKQVSFDPASASSFHVEESLTPSPPSSFAPDPLAQQPSQHAKSRMPHSTPPLHRRGRQTHDKENVRTNSGVHRASALVERSDGRTPATPQNLQEIDILSTKISRPVIPPYPSASPQLTESIRKRRAAAASSNDCSPAVKRMYRRCLLPAPSATSASQHPFPFTAHSVARQLKRRRDNDRIVWEAFNCAPAVAKKAAPQAVGPTAETASAATAALPPPTATAAFPLGSDAAATTANSIPEGTAVPAQPQPVFAFGSTVTAAVNTPASTDGAAAVDPCSTGQESAATSLTGGTAALTPATYHFGSTNPIPHPVEGPGRGTEAVPSCGATVNGEQPATSTSAVQLGPSLSTPEVTAMSLQAPPSGAGATFVFGVAPASERSATTAPSLNPAALFQGAASSVSADPAAPDAVANASGDSIVSLKPATAPTANPAGPATAWPASVPAPLAATNTTFQFGSNNQNQQPAIASFAPPAAFGTALSNTNPVSIRPAAPAAPAPAALFGAGAQQPRENGGGVEPAPSFSVSSSFATTPSSGAGGLGFGPANSSATSNGLFGFSSAAPQPGGAANSVAAGAFSSGAAQSGFGSGAAQPGFGSGAAAQPMFSSGAAQPGFGSGTAQPGFGSGAAQPGFGSGAGQPGFGPGVVQPGFGPGAGHPGFGSGLGSGAGQPGFGPGAAQPGFGPGAGQPGFGSGTGQQGFGPGAAQPGFGPGAGAGQPGFGPGAGQPGFGSGAGQPGFSLAVAQPGGAANSFASVTFGTSASTFVRTGAPTARPARNRNRPSRQPRRNG
jgi:hypothetical protein